MADILSRERRSANMRAIRSKGMSPELAVRRLVHKLGYRYRLHRADLPGTPDLVFSSRKKIVFVHGCFWHQHRATRCRLARVPKSRLEYWIPKLAGNKRRDARHQRELRRLGWAAFTVWECEVKDEKTLATVLRRFLDGQRKPLTERGGHA